MATKQIPFAVYFDLCHFAAADTLRGIYTAILPEFNVEHTATSAADLLDWLDCYDQSVLCLIYAPGQPLPSVERIGQVWGAMAAQKLGV